MTHDDILELLRRVRAVQRQTEMHARFIAELHTGIETLRMVDNAQRAVIALDVAIEQIERDNKKEP
jgi:hypothetical protein